MASYNAFAPFYDRFQRGIDYRTKALLFDRLIRGQGVVPGLLLDLACGTGSLSVELSRLGYDVIGADASADMLAVAQQKAMEQEQRVLFLCQRMEELDLFGTITACVCSLDSLNHLTEEKAFAQAIGRVSLFLEPGGVFVFDLNTPYKHRVLLADRAYVYEDDGALCVWQNETKNGLTQITLDFFERQKSGLWRRSGEAFAERAYELDTVRRICEENGLRIVSVTAGDGETPPDGTTDRWLIVAQKR